MSARPDPSGARSCRRPAAWLLVAALVAGCRAGPPAGTTPAATSERDAASAPAAGGGLLADVTAASGLDFVHVNGMSGHHYFVEMMGAGAALLDYDDDGDLDAYLVQGHPLRPGAPGDGAEPTDSDRLYRNDAAPGGAPRFADVTAASGIAATGYGMGVAVGDVDNDGRPDLFVANWGPDQLWRNAGDGTFTDVTATAGVSDPAWSTSAAFLDYDRDGWLDLFVVNYVAYSLAGHRDCFAPETGAVDYCGPQTYQPVADRLYRNRGDGTFEDVTAAAGLAGIAGSGLGAVAADLDADGWPDIYVANDGEENVLWRNRGDGRFENAALQSGTAVSGEGIAQGSMGVVAEDLDGNLRLDLFVTNLADEANTFYRQVGDLLFEDASRKSALGPLSAGDTGFGVGSLDVDNDGAPDLLVANGAVVDVYDQAVAGDPLPLRQRSRLYMNAGDGSFADGSGDAGPVLAAPDVYRGVAVGDVDGDGDADALVTRNGGAAILLENRVGQARHWLGLRLRVRPGGRDALGARVVLEGADGQRATRTARADGSYLSARDPRVLFGLGEAAGPSEAVVRWPDGRAERFAALAADRYHTLVYGEGAPAADLPGTPAPTGR